jgi:hypothetical protein
MRGVVSLESAFLIIKLSNVDENCRTLKRERNFKIYLNNPSMRAALFAPVEAGDSERIGHLAECAIFSQWQHSTSFRNLRYARWREGEVDIVYLSGPTQRPVWIGEIKWSDRILNNRSAETKSIHSLLKNHPSIRNVFFTSRTATEEFSIEGRPCMVWPSALYCYSVGRDIAAQLAPPNPPGITDSVTGAACT